MSSFFGSTVIAGIIKVKHYKSKGLIQMNQPIDNNSDHELGWWIEIMTAQPLYLYYFGAFSNLEQAKNLQAGFIEDLVLENALIVSTNIRFFQPQYLTLSGEDLRSNSPVFKRIPKNRIEINHRLAQKELAQTS
jgi:hypothetical protein